LARLGCAHENQPYVVPVYLVYHPTSSGEAYLYGFTTPGQKVTWMRANPLVCVEVDDVAALDKWMSVIATGRYEEMPEEARGEGTHGRTPERSTSGTAEGDAERERAWQILKTHAMWQEPGWTAGAVRAHRDATEPLGPIFYRIRIDHISGHEAAPDAKDSIPPGVPLPLDERAGCARH
jgi:nitroimidazol reductase NimA-like FMN-containing flavoprotein (pyridoxamine 5'-phosphate oxidase superfamily)